MISPAPGPEALPGSSALLALVHLPSRASSAGLALQGKWTSAQGAVGGAARGLRSGASGSAIWYGLCANDGTHCTGAPNNFGAEPMARLIGALFETGVPSSIYLDDVLIDEVEDAADDLLAAGEMTAAVHGIIHSNALRHVNYHHHHIHVRADGL